MRPKQAREAFLFLDRDRSGRLTLREVNEAVTAVFQCALPLTLHPVILPQRTFRAGHIVCLSVIAVPGCALLCADSCVCAIPITSVHLENKISTRMWLSHFLNQ